MIQVRRFGPHTWGLGGSYSQVLRNVCKAMPGMRWEPAARGWLGYADAVDAVIRRCRQDGVKIVGDVKPIDSETAAGINICYESLRDYQKTGVNWLVSHAAEGCLLADDVGIGKSAQAIRAARAFKGRTVVVAPAFVKRHWLAELARWWPDAKTAMLETRKATSIAADVDVVVINFDILSDWSNAIKVWGATTMVVDELQYLMTQSSKRTRAAAGIARTCAYRIGLTATPKPSHVRDLWSSLDVLSEARFGDKFFAFGRRYADGRQETIEIKEEGITVPRVVWRFDGSSHEEELQKRLGFMMLRRTKADVALQLPAVTTQIIELEVRHKQFKISSIASNRELRKQLDAAADSKIPQVIDMAADYVAAGRKLVVFTYRKVIAKTIGEALKQRFSKARVEVVTGEVSQQKRHDVAKAQPDVLCCTMDSMGVGISLAYASIGLFAELHYVPSTLIQCAGRLPRPDSTASNVLIVFACARGTADDLIRRVVISKMNIDQKVVGKQASKILETLEESAQEDTATKLRKLYERMLKEDDE